MRKHCLLLFLFLAAQNCFADSTTVQLCYNNEDNYFYSIDKEVNHFDSLGRLIQNETYRFEYIPFNQQDTGFHLLTRTDYGYNINGLVDTMLQTTVNFNGIFYTHTNFTYDPSGNLLMKLMLNGNTFPLDTGSQYLFQYDPNNNMIEQRYKQYVGNQNFWTIDLTQWNYDANDSITFYKKVNYQLNIPHDSIEKIKSFTPSGKLQTEIDFIFGVYIDSTKQEYQYDLNDSLISMTEYNSSTIWDKYRRHLFEYAADTTTEYFMNCPDTTCGDTTGSIIMVIDSVNHLLYYLSSDYDAGVGVLDINEYNSFGELVFSYNWSGGGGSGGHTFLDSITYDYNSAHDLIHQHTSSYGPAGIFYHDCYFYNLDEDSMLVLIDYDDAICTHSFVPVAVTVEGGKTPYQYDWSPGIHLSDSTIEQPYLMNVDSSIIYVLTVTDSNGRTASDSMNLFVLPDQFVPIVFIPIGSLCDSTSYYLTYSPPLSMNAGIWQIPSGSSSYNDTILASHHGHYTLTETNSNGCKYNFYTMVNFFPQPIFTLPADTSICLDDTLYLSAGNFIQYQWSNGSTASIIYTTSSIARVDTITVNVIDSNTCADSDTTIVQFQSCLSINDIKDLYSIVNYPDRIEINLLSNSNVEFIMTDIFGRIVIQKQLHTDDTIYLRDLHDGIYLLRLNEYSWERCVVN